MTKNKLNSVERENSIIKLRAIEPEDYDLILEMDKKVYPTNFPVTKEIIKRWYVKNPEFGMIYEKEGKIVGVCIAIPLNAESWKKLINGKLKESEMNEETLFDNLRDKEIGIHIYHIEKLDRDIKEFYKLSLKDMNYLIQNLRNKNKELKVIGLSGLCVTFEGISLFEKKFKCSERDYVYSEHILEKAGKKIILDTTSKQEIDRKLKEGYKYLNKCKMLVLYPDEKSIVWDYIINNLNLQKIKTVEEAILKKSEEQELEKNLNIKGYDFNKGVDFSKLIESFASSGFQATNLAKAIEIIKKMRQEKAFIFLGYTSNMMTSGLREIFRYLAEHKLVDVIVTTAGGIEEDFIKCLGDFKLGNFNADGTKLREKGINRTGNIFVPNSRYVAFENWVLPILKRVKNEFDSKKENLTASKLIRILGEEIGKLERGKESVYYHCWKNNIPVYCPALMDGSLGDMIYFFKSSNTDFKIDIVEDTWELNNTTIGKEKTGMIILGAGVVKHSICNANLYRNGADYAVYINSFQEFDGSDSGASPEEAKSWGKIKGSNESESIKVVGDATILFPLIVSQAFVK